MFGWVRCMKDQVVPTPPFTKPAAPRLPVDGVLDDATSTALQIFVGLDAKRGEYFVSSVGFGLGCAFVCEELHSRPHQTSQTRTHPPPFSK